MCAAPAQEVASWRAVPVPPYLPRACLLSCTACLRPTPRHGCLLACPLPGCSTARNELGVVYARSVAGAPMVPISWQEMQCPRTQAIENRKVAKVGA